MKDLSQSLQSIDFDDLRPYAKQMPMGTDDLLIIEELQRIDFDQKAVQTSFFSIAACTGGSAEFVLSGEPCRQQKGDLFIAFGRQTLDHFHKSDDFQGAALFQSLQFVQESLMSMRYLWPYLIHLMRHPVISLNEEERHIVRRDYQMLQHRLRTTDETFRKELIQTVLQVFYLDVCRMMEARSPRHEHYNARTYNLFYHFMQLLSAHYVQEREVSWYANALHLTPKYLSEVVKTVSGRTVSQWIALMVVMEIKSLLRNTDMSVKEISLHMNFPNQSFMGRYFKNGTGMSPLDYRKHLKL